VAEIKLSAIHLGEVITHAAKLQSCGSWSSRPHRLLYNISSERWNEAVIAGEVVTKRRPNDTLSAAEPLTRQLISL